MTTDTREALALLPCPFCGNKKPTFERMGTPRQSCIVECGHCGCRHESGDEGSHSGSSWNERAALATQPAQPRNQSNFLSENKVAAQPSAQGEAVAWLAVNPGFGEPGEQRYLVVADETHEHIRDLLGAFPVYASAPAAPAQPSAQGEAVAWRARVEDMWFHAASRDALVTSLRLQLNREPDALEPLYASAPAAPAQAVPLTDEQIDQIADDGHRNAAGGIYATAVYQFAAAIERAHGIAPKAAQP